MSGVGEVGESGLNYLSPSVVRKLIWGQRGKFSERCGDGVAPRFLALCDVWPGCWLVNQGREGERDDGKGNNGVEVSMH